MVDSATLGTLKHKSKGRRTSKLILDAYHANKDCLRANVSVGVTRFVCIPERIKFRSR